MGKALRGLGFGVILGVGAVSGWFETFCAPGVFAPSGLRQGEKEVGSV